jgi:hypothetical protein
MAFRLDTATGLRQNLSMDNNTEYLIETANALREEIATNAYDTLNRWIVAQVSNSMEPAEWQAVVDRAKGYALEFGS